MSPFGVWRWATRMNDLDFRGPSRKGDGATMMSPMSPQQLLEFWEQGRKSTPCLAKTGEEQGEFRDLLEGGTPEQNLSTVATAYARK